MRLWLLLGICILFVGCSKSEKDKCLEDPNARWIKDRCHCTIRNMRWTGERCEKLQAKKPSAGGGSHRAAPAPKPTPQPQALQQQSKDGCRISGCHFEICHEEEWKTSCEKKRHFQCYRDGNCEKQANGKCGWTDNLELRVCFNRLRHLDPDTPARKGAETALTKEGAVAHQ